MNGSTVIGPDEHKANNRFGNLDNFESYLNAMDNDYDSEDVIFTRYVHKTKTPQFKFVERSAHASLHGRVC